MLLTDAEREKVESGELKEEDIPSLADISDAFVTERVAEYSEYITTQHETIPEQLELFRDFVEENTIYDFLKEQRSVAITITMHDALVITTALQRFMDYNKYTIADAELSGFEMDDVYKRGLILDTIVAENWYGMFVEMLKTAKEEFKA